MNASMKSTLFILILAFMLINVLPVSIDADDVSDPVNPENTEKTFRTLTTTVQIDPGESFYIYFDPADFALKEKPPVPLPVECQNAIEAVPDWLKGNLSFKFRQLSPDARITYANLILSSPDTKYTDEIAFCVAHSAVENLQSDNMFPEIFTHNADLIYKSDEYLDYVDIIEKDDYTTVVYKDKEGLEQEAPKEIYYWYIVHPKLSDELPTYVDPDYDFTSDPPFSRNYGVAPPVGKFWRDWLFNHNDTAADYDGPAKKNPLLRELLSEAETLWDAIGKCNNWMSNSMSFTSNEERPVQPVRIYRKHIGRCGEYQDMRNAIARAGLIPSTCTLNSAEDHVWNEFWDNRWIHWDGSIDKPNSYDNDLGGFFHKDLSSVFNTRGDGHIWGVTERYTPTCKLITTVIDSNGNTVDGALVTIYTENFYNPELRSITTWGTTDHTGTFEVRLGNLRNYWATVETDDLGNDPVAGYTQVIENSSADRNYGYTFHLPLAATETRGIDQEPPDVLDPKYEMDIEFEVVNSITNAGNAYTGEHGNIFNEEGQIDFFITDSQNFNLYSNELYFSCYNFKEKRTFDELSFIVPGEEDQYYVVFSNDVTQDTTQIVQITIKIISEMTFDIIYPREGLVFDIDETIWVKGNAWSPDKIKSVEFKINEDGSWIPALDGSYDPAKPYDLWEYYWDTTGSKPGNYTLFFRATDGTRTREQIVNVSLTDSTLPDIILDSPMNNAVIQTGNDVYVNGTVSDNVEIESLFLIIDSDDASAIDISSSIKDDQFRYRIITYKIGEGVHTVTVKAFDTSSNFDAVMRTLDIKELQVPELRIDNPLENGIFKLGDTVRVNGYASDNDEMAKLELSIDNDAPIDITSRIDPGGMWYYDLHTGSAIAGEGYHKLTVFATDTSGNTAEAGVNIILDGTIPALSITMPVDDSVFFASEPFTISGTAFDANGIQSLEIAIDDGAPYDIKESLGSKEYSYDYRDTDDLKSGEHKITITATDAVGQIAEATVTIKIDALDPFVDIDKVDGSIEIGDTVTLKGTVYDDIEIGTVTLIIDSHEQIDITPYVSGQEWEFELDTTGYDPGKLRVRVTATDTAGNVASDEISIKLVEDLQSVDTNADTVSDDKKGEIQILNIPLTFFILISIVLIIILLVTYLIIGKVRS